MKKLAKKLAARLRAKNKALIAWISKGDNVKLFLSGFTATYAAVLIVASVVIYHVA